MSGVSGRSELFGIALSFACLFPACGENDEIRVRDGEQEEAFCDANCVRDGQCSGRNHHASCMSYCEARVSGLEDYRPEAVAVVAECIVELPCSEFYAEGGFVPCWEKAEREVEPNRTVRRFCFAWSTRWFECGFSYSTERCEEDWSISSADYLERMSSCIEVDCADLDACAEAIQGGG